MTTPPPPKRILAAVCAALVLSTALHVVPQALRDHVDPAWSMLLLMVADALVLAWLGHSLRSLRSALLLLLVLAGTVWLRQQALAAAPSVGFNLMMATVFGLSLRRKSRPMLLRVAAAAYPQDLTPALTRYLRGLTWVWTLFFAAQATMSLLLALFAPFAVWSFFVNVLSVPLTLLLFVGEWLVRRRFRPDLAAHTPLQILSGIAVFAKHTSFGLEPASSDIVGDEVSPHSR